jgi:hypothetical protein
MLGKKEFLFWGHLGLGDQICYAKLYESWHDFGYSVRVPCHRRYLETLRVMYSYLPNILFYPINSEDYLSENILVRELKNELALPLIMSGHGTLQIMQNLFPKDGCQTNLLRTAGLKVENLFSTRFRNHLLEINTLLPSPSIEFAFLNRRHSRGLVNLPAMPTWDTSMFVIEEKDGIELYRYAKIINEAHELRSCGSAFFCLAVVMGSRATSKFYFGHNDLKSDNPDDEWIQIRS